MSSNVKDAKGTIYAYEEKLVYDPDEKKEVLKQVLIGKIDKETGKIIPIEDEKISIFVPAVINSNNRTSKPEKIVLDTTKTGRITFDEKQNKVLYDRENVKIAIEKKGSNKEINTLLSIKFDSLKFEEENGVRVSVSTTLTPFDRIVYDAVTTLYVEGNNEFITPQMIFRVMTGDYSKTLSPKYEEAINESLIRMMYTRFTINASQEGAVYKNLSDFVYRSYLLPAAQVSAKINGTNVICFKIFETPPLYEYASRKKQIARIDLDLLSLPFKTDSENEKRESQTSMMLAHYLMRRIIALKSLSNTIVYNTVYEFLGMSDASRLKKFRIRENIKKILESWKKTIWGDIKILGFEEKKKRGAVYEIVINYEVIKCDK